MPLDDDYADVISAALPAKPRQPRPQPSSSTYDPDTALPLISKYESGDRNIPNYRYDKGHTAQGHYQITNTNWRTKGPQAGVDLKQYPSAMAAPKEVQAKVAKLMYGERGFADWAPFNPRLKAAIGRGEQPTPQDPYDDVVKAALPPKPKQQTKSADPYDDVINAAISGQTLPPQSKLNRVNQPQTPATNPRSSRQQSVPTAEQALQKIMDDVNRATGIPKPRTQPRQPQAPFIDRTIPNMQEMLTTPDTSSAGREREQVRQEVIADRAARRGTAASPTIKGLQRILSAPATSFAELARPEDENVSNETTERIEAMRAARRPEVQQLANDYRKQIRTSAAAANLGSGRGGQWTQELLAKATAGLSDYVAAGLRAVANPVLSPAGALLTDEDKAAKFADTVNTHALALQQAAEAEGADRNFASKLAQDAVAGAISSAPDMAAMMVGVPAPLAFGAGGATRALGRGQSPEQVANAAGTSALSAAPFEIPVGGTGLRGAIKRAGTVGAGTTALELAQGRTPSEALKGGLTNAIMSVGGGKKPEESSLNRGLDRIIEQEQARVSPSQEVNIPERPETVNAQLEAVQQGTRPAVLLTKGERRVPIPKGLTAVSTSEGTFYYDPKQVSRETINAKVEDGTYGELLGHVQPKSEATTEAVVARAPDGTEIQSSAVSPENVTKQAEVMQTQYPEANVEMGGNELAKQVIADRVEAPQIPKEVLEARARKAQRGQNEAQLNPELQSGSGADIPRVAETPPETRAEPLVETTPRAEAESVVPTEVAKPTDGASTVTVRTNRGDVELDVSDTLAAADQIAAMKASIPEKEYHRIGKILTALNNPDRAAEFPEVAADVQRVQSVPKQAAAPKLENDVFTFPTASPRRTITVFKNPTGSDLREIRDRFLEEYPNAPKGEPKYRTTRDAKGNEYVWMSGEGQHGDVEPLIRNKWGEEVNKNMEPRVESPDLVTKPTEVTTEAQQAPTESQTPTTAKSKLDLMLDAVESKKGEVTFDVRDYTEEQKQRIIDAAKARGLDAASDGKHILVRDLREATPTTETERAAAEGVAPKTRVIDRGVGRALSAQNREQMVTLPNGDLVNVHTYDTREGGRPISDAEAQKRADEIYKQRQWAEQKSKELSAKYPRASVEQTAEGIEVRRGNKVVEVAKFPSSERAVAPPNEPTKVAETPRATTPEPAVPKVITDARARKAKRAADKAEGIEYRRAGADPYEIIDDLLDHGWTVYSKAKPKFDEWAKEMRDKFGEVVEPHLKKVYATLTGAKEESATETPRAEREGQPPATTGIAHRVETIARGEEPQRGQAVGAQESVERGRQLLRDGRDPQEVINKFKDDGAISAESMALVRAKHEELARAANQAFDKGGLNSPEFKEAEKARQDFYNDAVKPMQTAWSNTGRAQQGETAIDTGTFYGLYRGFKDAKGREPSEREAANVKRLAERNVKAESDVADASSRLATELNKAAGIQDLPPDVQKAMSRFVDQSARESRRGARRQTRKTLDEEAVVIKQNIAQAFQKVKNQSGVQPLGLARLDPSGEITKQVIAYAKNRVKAGVTDVAQLVDDVHATVKDFAADVTKREITEALLGQGLPKSARTESAWAKVKSGISDSLKAEDGTIARDKLGAKLQGNPKQISNEDATAVWEYVRENYVNKGNTDFADIRTKAASDLGVSPDTVTRALSSTKATKRVSDEMWARMADRRQVRQNAESWVKAADTPLAVKAFEDARRLFFIKATLGHGAVAPFTHAPANVFIPSRWATFWPNFARTYKFMVSKGAHEQAVTDLVRSPNYIEAKRAGLANDPKKGYDEYQSPWMAKTLGKLGISGNRAFDSLKTMRQDMFDSAWNKMAEADRTPEMAKLLAQEVNSSTGASKALSGGDWPSKFVNKAMFAAPLEASRWDFLVRDNYRAMKAITNWKGAKPEERYMAKRVASRNAQLVGVYASLLAANQGLLSATGSDDKVNFTDPTKPDFLAFKIAGHNISPAGGMLTAIRFVGNLVNVAMEDKKPRQKIEDAALTTFKYGRGKLSPLFGTATDVALQSDFSGRPLPFSKQEGTARAPRYTWPEYLLSTQTPIPVGEAARDVYATLRDQGMDEGRAGSLLKALGKGAAVGTVAGTGIRITPSYKPDPETLKKAARKEQAASLITKYRSGRVSDDDLDAAVDKGDITESDKKNIKQQGSMSLQEAEFHNIKDPQEALDTFTRMSATQRERVREIMERKAWSLLYSDSMEGNATEKERKRAKLQQQFDRLGLTPKASSTNRGGLRGAVQSAFA